MLHHSYRLCLCALLAWNAFSLRAENEKVEIPALLRAPAGTKLLHTAEAKGVQIYIGVKNGAALEWKLEAPRAELTTGGAVWKHYAGPTWEGADGSKIKKSAAVDAVVQAPAPNPKDDIPWLLIKVQPDGDKTGLLSGVQYVQRINTKGGKAPAQLPAKEGERVEVPYTAAYQFHAEAK